MALKNGMWNIITMRLCPGSMSLRHFIPLTFVISLLFLLVTQLFFYPLRLLFLAEVLSYLILSVYFSFRLASSKSEFFLLLILFPIFHMTYGFGSLKGMVKLLFTDFK
jgi:hypothetical protein